MIFRSMNIFVNANNSRDKLKLSFNYSFIFMIAGHKKSRINRPVLELNESYLKIFYIYIKIFIFIDKINFIYSMFNEKLFLRYLTHFQRLVTVNFLIIYMTFTSKFEFFNAFKNIC